MAVRIHGHHLKVSRKIHSYIESKLPRIEKYAADNIQTIEFILDKDGPHYTVELIFKAGPIKITAKQKDVDQMKAIDLLIDKAERALKKQHDKMTGRKKHVKTINRSAKKANPSPDVEPLPLIATSGPSLGNGRAMLSVAEGPVLHEKLNIRIFRSPKTTSERMTVQEAAEVLFFKDENFLCFNNADSNGVSILYRRKDGNFALMDTKPN